MKPITINLAGRPFRNNTVVASTVAAGAVLLAAATVFNLFVFFNYGSAYAQLQRDQRADREKLASFQEQERVLRQEVKTRDFRRVYERGVFAHDLIIKRAFSWTLLFNKLEAVMPPDVMMTAIRPNITADGIVVRIEGVAKNHGALITFEDRLLQHLSFSRVFPSTERRINPNRSELSFILTFDYMPRPPSEVVAGAAGAVSAPPAGVPGGTAPSPAAGTAATSPALPPLGAAASTAPPAVAAPGPKSPAAAGAPGLPVGRDGFARPTEVITRRMIAPGGFYDPLAAAAPPAAARQPARVPASSRTAAPSRTTTAVADPRPEAAATPPPEDGPGPMAGSAGGRGGSRRRDESDLATPASRLDVDLNFVLRPITEVYGALEQAHGIHFEIDAGIDRDQKISANLSGRSLGDALALVAGTARHRVTRARQGVYRVADSSGGAPLREATVQEEDLVPPQGARP